MRSADSAARLSHDATACCEPPMDGSASSSAAWGMLGCYQSSCRGHAGVLPVQLQEGGGVITCLLAPCRLSSSPAGQHLVGGAVAGGVAVPGALGALGGGLGLAGAAAGAGAGFQGDVPTWNKCKRRPRAIRYSRHSCPVPPPPQTPRPRVRPPPTASHPLPLQHPRPPAPPAPVLQPRVGAAADLAVVQLGTHNARAPAPQEGLGLAPAAARRSCACSQQRCLRKRC